MQSDKLAKFITETLDENKAKNIVGIDVRSLTQIADYMIICTATSNRQAISLAEKVSRACREHGVRPFGEEGNDSGAEWILLDMGDVIVHVMLEEAREFYNLEKLWDTAKIAREQSDKD